MYLFPKYFIHIEYIAQHSEEPSANKSPKGFSFSIKFPLNITKNTPVIAIINPITRSLVNFSFFVK